MQRQCNGATKSSERCRSFALPGSDYCVMHDPAKVADLAAWRRRGGEGKANTRRARARLPRDLADVLDRMMALLPKVESGDVLPGQATAMASVATCIVRLWQAGELDQRLRAVEEQLGIEHGGRSA